MVNFTRLDLTRFPNLVLTSKEGVEFFVDAFTMSQASEPIRQGLSGSFSESQLSSHPDIKWPIWRYSLPMHSFSTILTVLKLIYDLTFAPYIIDDCDELIPVLALASEMMLDDSIKRRIYAKFPEYLSDQLQTAYELYEVPGIPSKKPVRPLPIPGQELYYDDIAEIIMTWDDDKNEYRYENEHFILQNDNPCLESYTGPIKVYEISETTSFRWKDTESASIPVENLPSLWHPPSPSNPN